MATSPWVPRHGATTPHTHGRALDRAGAPRLVHALEDRSAQDEQPVYWLHRPLMLIGSDRACDIVLPDLEPVHTVVFHDHDDEYLLDNCGPEVRVDGVLVEESVLLRTGARLDLGPHSLAYVHEGHRATPGSEGER